MSDSTEVKHLEADIDVMLAAAKMVMHSMEVTDCPSCAVKMFIECLVVIYVSSLDMFEELTPEDLGAIVTVQALKQIEALSQMEHLVELAKKEDSKNVNSDGSSIDPKELH